MTKKSIAIRRGN